MSLNPTLDRRELIKRVAYLMGGAVSAPAVLGILQGCTAKTPTGTWTPVFFTAAQAALVEEVADILIPRTDTPGAKDVGVPAFIDLMLKDTYPKRDQDRYLEGLNAFEAGARARHGRDFLKLDAGTRVDYVRHVHEKALLGMRTGAMNGDTGQQFLMMTKELTLLGFFSSEVGCTQVLQHSSVPGEYRCVPLAEAGNGRTWAE
jgi:hypothetical protein